jgi:PAS domain S-box-containing protein
MNAAEIPLDEKRRLRNLQSYRVLDTAPDQAFDDFTLLATHTCGTPIALVTLVDEKRQWFKSRVGIDFTETPREMSFCAHTILEPGDAFIVHDAWKDPRFSENPLVTGDPHIRFYAGIPLVSPEGFALGAMSVMDRVPRQLSPSQLDCLRAIARQVIQQLILRRSMKEQLKAVLRLQEAQEALTQAEDLMENASDMVHSVDPQGKVDYVNLAWCRALGYSPTDALGLSMFDVIHPAWRKPFAELFERALNGENVGTINTIFVARDAREIPVEGTFNIKSTEGKSHAIRGIFRDISAKRKEEQKRREAEDRYTALFNDSTEGIVQFDVNGGLVSSNPAMARMLGYESSDELIYALNVLNQPLYVNERDRVNLIRAMIRRGSAQGFECQLLRKDGGIIWIRASGRAVRGPDDKLLYFEGIIIDLTDRKVVEIERDRLFNLSQNFFCIADFDGYFKRLNPAWESLGFSLAELLSRPFIDFVHPDDREATIAEMAGIHTGQESINFENRYRCGDGSYRWLLWNAAPAVEQRLIYASARDITDIKMFEQELKRNNLELGTRNREVEEASRLKSEFLANMSHELRTPLNGIIGFSELMYNEEIGPVSAEHKEFLGDILTSGRHLLQLINDILDLSKVEAGKLEFRPEELDLAKTIQEVCDILRAMSAKKHIDVKYSIDHRVRNVFVDPGKLKQVLYNYLSNALKFTPERGRVRVVASVVGDDEFRIEVQDSGIGIHEKDMSRLFVEFQQLDEGASKKYQGTGLGLALTKKIVEAQGGRVGVTSAIGTGSIFFAVLPRRAQSSELESQASGVEQPGALAENGVRILVIDDEPGVLKLMATTLRSLGYTPILAPDGLEGLAAVAEYRPDAIILDLVMPHVNGFEFLEQLRAEPANQDIPVIVWTSQDLSSQDSAGLRALSQGIVLKRHGDVALLLEELKSILVPRTT